jgi:glutaminase
MESYIPELSKVNPKNFGTHISTINKVSFGIGNYNDEFSIQSISKVLALILAYRIVGDEIWDRFGV